MGLRSQTAGPREITCRPLNLEADLVVSKPACSCEAYHLYDGARAHTFVLTKKCLKGTTS